mgnify:CR=1 FL=1
MGSSTAQVTTYQMPEYYPIPSPPTAYSPADLGSLLRELASRSLEQPPSGTVSMARRQLALSLTYAARAAEAVTSNDDADVLLAAQALLTSVLQGQPPIPVAPRILHPPVSPMLMVAPGSVPGFVPSARMHVFEAVYINLATRTDRLASVQRELASAGLAAARFEAATGATTPDSHVARTWDSTLNAKYDTKTVGHPCVTLSSGERGCAMSHRALWEVVAARPINSPPVLILEDDAVLSVDFVARLVRLIDAVERTWTDPSSRTVCLYLCADVARWRGEALEVEPGLGVREAACASAGLDPALLDPSSTLPVCVRRHL